MALDGQNPLNLPTWPTSGMDHDAAVECVAEGLYGLTVSRLCDLLDTHVGVGLVATVVDVLYRAAPYLLTAGLKEQRESD